ncbi:eukaryotic translation initiation factor 5A, putative [Entamoeba invadens IP1]|uniref:Eukaryotic translation initiation factor 5A, putative n=1 Tax=Entamoeba invadens IP1 TaxID=370355 RepID=A0A0A1UCH7_ENTIV|nr:eukaryotic translation initiation factor 5A, putative [Entamoeba invadens IP1]ELP93610.1 eukaryotic translation initiation factor 5A, putative [Entamoeba invadens IP1]|eukprot:XP_004260381.1 eukaryotic translation initiation factor 5A, putative [Entamoeba invadens IP1]
MELTNGTIKEHPYSRLNYLDEKTPNQITIKRAREITNDSIVIVPKEDPERDIVCKVINYTRTKTGKLGMPKITITAIGVFDRNTYEHFFYQNQSICFVELLYTNYNIVDTKDGFLSLVNNNMNLREDVNIPPNDLGNYIIEHLQKGEMVMCKVATFGNFDDVVEAWVENS